MSYHYAFLQRAQQEYEDAVQWYLERSVSAAEGFVAAIDAVLVSVCTHPTRWRNEYKNYYELGAKKYPYTIIYSIDEAKKMILILSVYHQKRNPKKKYRKPK